jgi:GNAT superfamily N-acetyltransferase
MSLEEPAPCLIRPAEIDDAPLLADLVRELARYEELEHFAVATADDIRRYLFGPRVYAEAILAETRDGRTVGFALFFHSFSTFRGRPSLYLEDIYVRTEFRGHGIGKALLQAVARIARERGCTRMEWAVLDWNEPAIGFYKALGAKPLSDWTLYRLEDDALIDLADA